MHDTYLALCDISEKIAVRLRVADSDASHGFLRPDVNYSLNFSNIIGPISSSFLSDKTDRVCEIIILS